MKQRMSYSAIAAALAVFAIFFLVGCPNPAGTDPAGTSKSSDKAISAFGFVGVAATGTVDPTARTIAVTVPSGTAVTALVATFTATGVTVKVGSVVQVSGTTPNDFTNPVTYTVVAEDGSSVDFTVTVSSAPLLAPAGFGATGGNVRVILSWNAASGAASYNVYRSTVSDSQGAKIASPITPGYTDTPVTNGTTYYYRVTAVNAAGESAPSAQASAVPGFTWTERTSSGGFATWADIASSSDGTHLAAVSGNGYIYTSSDSGATWTERTAAGSRYWWTIASSADGTHLAAATQNTAIYTSSDSGATWIERTNAGTHCWRSIASSADGSRLAAVAANGHDFVFTSSDYGETWIQRDAAGDRAWSTIASSADGTRLAAAQSDGYIYTSADSGATWTERTGPGAGRDWTSIASSSDGTRLTAASGNSYIYTSSDSGATWTARTSSGSKFWLSVASSADGVYLAACAAMGDYIYTSTDSGATWTTQTAAGSRNWGSIASSSDGAFLAAADGGEIEGFGVIFTGQ